MTRFSSILNLDEATPTSTRCVSLFITNVRVGSKALALLQEELGSTLLGVTKKGTNHWELRMKRKNALKAIKVLVKFFDRNGSKQTAEGESRLHIPFRKILSKPLQKRYGLVLTPIGLVFKECAEKVKLAFAPKVDKAVLAFKKWDKKIDNLLAAHDEKKQIPVKRWLEQTTYTPTKYLM